MTEKPEESLQGWRVGFAGLGLMGRPMALHLYRAGAVLALWNRTRSVAEQLARRGQSGPTRPAYVEHRDWRS